MSRMECLRVEVPEDGLSFEFNDVEVSMINNVGSSGDKRLVDIWYLDKEEFSRSLKPIRPYMIVFDRQVFPPIFKPVASTDLYNDKVMHLVKYNG